MPLNRDQQHAKNYPSSGPSSLTNDRSLDMSKHRTGPTSNVLGRLQNERADQTWQGLAKDANPIQNLQKFKLPLPIIDLDKSGHNRSLTSTAHPNAAPKQSGTAGVQNLWKPKVSHWKFFDACSC